MTSLHHWAVIKLNPEITARTACYGVVRIKLSLFWAQTVTGNSLLFSIWQWEDKRQADKGEMKTWTSDNMDTGEYTGWQLKVEQFHRLCTSLCPCICFCRSLVFIFDFVVLIAVVVDFVSVAVFVVVFVVVIFSVILFSVLVVAFVVILFVVFVAIFVVAL